MPRLMRMLYRTSPTQYVLIIDAPHKSYKDKTFPLPTELGLTMPMKKTFHQKKSKNFLRNITILQQNSINLKVERRNGLPVFYQPYKETNDEEGTIFPLAFQQYQPTLNLYFQYRQRHDHQYQQDRHHHHPHHNHPR